MKQEELEAVLAEHTRWLKGKGGKRADLSAAQLSDADLRYANLRGANLSGADLRSANLGYANLSCANLCSANLGYANLRGANLSGADLSRADLSCANLSCADLYGADLSAAQLSGADLSEVRGIRVAACHWSGHGERGRPLSAVLLPDGLRFYCGCFSGSEQALRDYIANSNPHHAASRTEALEFLLSRF